jgi:hypothetical protein
MEWITLIIQLISACFEKNDRKVVRKRIRANGAFVKAALRGAARDRGYSRFETKRFVREGRDFIGSLSKKEINELLDAAEASAAGRTA